MTCGTPYERTNQGIFQRFGEPLEKYNVEWHRHRVTIIFDENLIPRAAQLESSTMNRWTPGWCSHQRKSFESHFFLHSFVHIAQEVLHKKIKRNVQFEGTIRNVQMHEEKFGKLAKNGQRHRDNDGRSSSWVSGHPTKYCPPASFSSSLHRVLSNTMSQKLELSERAVEKLTNFGRCSYDFKKMERINELLIVTYWAQFRKI